jgi:hypothetical protein
MKKHATKSLMVSAGISAAVALAIAAPASAHHSGVGYDMSKTLAAEATIKEFRWGAPHSAAVFVIKDKDGKPQDVNVASTTPAMMVRQGFKLQDFKIGTKVQITWHPAKSGVLGGTLATIKLPDGREFKDAEFGPRGSQAGGPPGAGGPQGGGLGDEQAGAAQLQ